MIAGEEDLCTVSMFCFCLQLAFTCIYGLNYCKARVKPLPIILPLHGEKQLFDNKNANFFPFNKSDPLKSFNPPLRTNLGHLGRRY